MTTKDKSRDLAVFDSFVLFVNNYSILVALGAVSTSFFFLHYYQHPISFTFLWLMGSTTWIVFTADHLLDAAELKEKATTHRHQAHYKNRTVLTYLVALLIGSNAYLVWINRFELYILKGALLGVLMIIYLLFIKFKQHKQSIILSKELLVAMGATLGMCLLPGYVAPLIWTGSHFLLITVFFLINMANILTFSRFDLKADEIQNMTSMVYQLGYARSSRIIFNILNGCFLLSAVWLFSFRGFYKVNGALALIIMLNILAVVNLKYYAFKEKEYYRFWGDFIYLVPGMTVFLST